MPFVAASRSVQVLVSAGQNLGLSSILVKADYCEQCERIDCSGGLMRTVLSLVVYLQGRVLAENQVTAGLKAITPEFVCVKPVEDLIAGVKIGHETPSFCRPAIFKAQPRAPRVA